MPLSRSSIAHEETLQIQPVEYVILSGGGAKGVLYSGVHKALSDSGVLHGVKGIAGSSAGAISAAFIATGMSPEDFKKTTNEQNFKDLLGKGKIKGLPIEKDGMPLYELLDKHIRQNIGDFLHTSDIGTLARNRLSEVIQEREESIKALEEKTSNLLKMRHEISTLTELKKNFRSKEDLVEINSKIKFLNNARLELETTVTALSNKKNALSQGLARLEEIVQNPELSKQQLLAKCSPSGKICFKDLATMHFLDPQKFKDLHITAVQKNTGDLIIFNAADSPDVEIALACRASASIPRVFKAVEINGVQYVDGGFRDNTPYQAFNKKPNTEHTQNNVENITNDKAKLAEAYRQRKTLAFVFANDSSKEALYSAKETVGDNPSKIRQFITGIMNAISRNKHTDIAQENQLIKQHSKLNRVEKLTSNIEYKLNVIGQKRSDNNNVKIGFKEKVLAKIMQKLSGVGGNHSYDQTLEEGYTEMRANRQNTVALDPKAVGTMDFDKAQKHRDHMYATGYINTMEHLNTAREHTTKQDPNLALQSIMLQVYDNVEKTRPTKLWQHKVHGTNASQKNLLEFVTPQKWKDRTQDDVVKEYIESIVLGNATKPGQKSFSVNTPAAQSMINILNHKATPDSVKEKFAQVLGKEPNGKPFDKKHLENFIIKNKELFASKAPNTSRDI